MNERVIDGQWLEYLGEYAELVRIPSYSFIKLFGGSSEQWIRRFPHSLDELSARLAELCKVYRVRMIYVNMPVVIPYILMARTYAGLDLGILFLAHSVGSEYWVKQWLAIAPWLTERDVLLTSTSSAREALLRISPAFRRARTIPLSIALNDPKLVEAAIRMRTGNCVLCICRLEDVKNVHLLLDCFNEMRREIPTLQLTIAGEYTGGSREQMASYKRLLDNIVLELGLDSHVTFVGAIEGRQKDDLFSRADLLINLSTDPGETFGYNLLEAKVWGVPVVCSCWDGFREVVRHGRDGYAADCFWEGEEPELQLDQVLAYSLRLLHNRSLRLRLSRQAAKSASAYDYKTIVPAIVEAVRTASISAIADMPEAASIAVTEIAGLNSLYNMEKISRIPYLHLSPLQVGAAGSSHSLRDWMGMVKPIIRHYAGRWGDGEL